MRCAGCRHWLRGTRVRFSSSERWEPAAGEGFGLCRGPLEVPTKAQFGCVDFEQASDPADQEIVVRHEAEPWQIWTMVPCPDCHAAGSSSDVGCHRCAGTGNVRLYGDGYLADERTREHAREAELRKERERRALAETMRAELAALEAAPEPARPARVEGFL